MKDWRTSAQRDRSRLSSDVAGVSPRRQSLSSLVASLKLTEGDSHDPTHPESPEALRSSCHRAEDGGEGGCDENEEGWGPGVVLRSSEDQALHLWPFSSCQGCDLGRVCAFLSLSSLTDEGEIRTSPWRAQA